MSEDHSNLPGDDEEKSVRSLEMEELGKAKRKYFSNINWKIAAGISSVLALLLAIGLSVTLGVFLAKTECGPPPRHLVASSDFWGSGEPGTKITYVCPRPLVFPDNQETFTLRCKENLHWNLTDVPDCGRDGVKHCNGLLNDDDFDLSLVTKDDLGIFKVEVTLQGHLPKSYLLDVDSEDEERCSYGEEISQKEYGNFRNPEIWLGPPRLVMERIFQKKTMEKMGELPVYSITVTDSAVDPGMPYEIRIRGSGNFVALSVVQGDHLNITFHELDIVPQATTTSPTVGNTDSSSTLSSHTPTQATTPTTSFVSTSSMPLKTTSTASTSGTSSSPHTPASGASTSSNTMTSVESSSQSTTTTITSTYLSTSAIGSSTQFSTEDTESSTLENATAALVHISNY